MYNSETNITKSPLNITKHANIVENNIKIKDTKSNTSTTAVTTNSKSTSTVPIEGGGRYMTNGNDKPIIEESVEKTSVGRKISARKGVNFSEPEDPIITNNTNNTLTTARTTSNSKVHVTTVLTILNNTKNGLVNSTTITSKTTTQKPRKKKPLFTLISGDHVNVESESFIESPTTGKDYVLPIVLIILAFPVLLFIIKLIYKRGTEFTERQQYHRMYLIDGMYNTR